MVKRKSSTKKVSPINKAKSRPAKAKPAKKSKVSVEDTPVTSHPSEAWKVVFTGVFDVRPRTELQKVLEARGVKVVGTVSGKTTHLILGTDGTTKNGKTGRGSTKHAAAVERGTTILSEKEVWDLINNKNSDADADAGDDDGGEKATENGDGVANDIVLVEEELLDSADGEDCE